MKTATESIRTPETRGTVKALFTIALAAASSSAVFAQTEYPRAEGLSAPHGYSHVVVTNPGKLVFISGQVANDRSGHLIGKGDLRAQTTQIFENLKIALAAAGATFENVVKITWYVKNYQPQQLPVIREVRDTYIGKAALPASTLVGVTSLFQEDYLLEVDAIAVVPEKHNKAR